MEIKNKIVLISGASSGIGAACAEVFAEAGAKLILLARRKDNLTLLTGKLLKEYGTKCYPIVCDIRDYDLLSLKLGHLDEWKNIDILINNAGLSRGLEKIQDGKLENWEEMIDTNIKGLLYLSKLVIPGMVERKSGHIFNIGSLAGREVYPGGNVYCGTKHAVKALSKAMVIELNTTGIRVTNIDPGLVETEFSEVRFRGDKERAKKTYEGFVPLIGRDIAEIILFAASRPQHVMIQDLLVTPTAQANTTILDKH
ncbi:MAG: SDR family NAD(P)-dependent oxidoreductase [FCB group bacterium]|jgi:NADP-dependent 3-hydroxy acid dehydrogenase YdfG